MPTTTLQVTFVSESAAYDNTFGWYNKVTGEGGILFADVEMQGQNAPLTPGATRTFTVDTADLANISFFLIPDGADHNPPNDLTGDIKVIQLSNGRWVVADVDANGNVIYIHGRPDILEGVGADALFSETSKNAGGVDYASSVVGPSQTAATLAGDTADGPTGLIAWEDIAAKKHGHTYGAPGDADYNDAVFNVSILPPPNTAPETNAASASGNEDAAISIALSGSDTDGVVTSFRVTSLPLNGTLYSDAGLTQQILLNGTVTAAGNAATVFFVPASNFNGSTSFQYASIDNAGAQDQTPATASIAVAAVNDAPTATNLTQNLTVNEDDPATTLFTLAPTVADADSASVTATLTVAAAQGTLNGAGAGVLAAGVWTYTISGAPATVAAQLAGVTFDSAADFNGAASVEVAISDGLNGPQGSNPTGTVSITVNSVNDAPTAANLTQSLTIDEDAAPTTLFTLAPSVADIDSASVTATLTVAAAQGTLNGAGAGVLAAGVWTYTITGAPATVATALAGVTFDSAQDFDGSASVGVTISDGQNGPQGTNPAGTVTVTVNPENDAPVAADFTFDGSNAVIGNTSLVVDDPTDGAPDPAGPQKTITGDLLAGGTDVDTPSASWTITAVGGGTTVTDANGTIIFEPDGDFTYLPAAGVTGNVVYSYQLNDNDALGNQSDIGQITINVATPKVWYVDATNGSDTTGDGTSDNPFATLTRLNGVTGDGTTNDDVDGAGDIIFMYGGDYSGGIVLEAGQQIITKEHGLTVNGTVLEAADSGSTTTIDGTVTLAAGDATTFNTIQGVDFGDAATFALTGTSIGDAKVNTVTAGVINNTSGGAISIDGSGTGMNLQFSSVTSTGGTNAISFDDARGTFNSGAGALSGATGNTVNITGNDTNDDLTFTYGGSISGDGNELVNITDQTGGTKTFNGAITDAGGNGGGIDVSSNTGSSTVTFTHSVSLSTGNATGVSFDANGANVALNFNNTNAASTGLDITTTGGTGFDATGGGTVTVLDPTGAQGNSISSGTGGALNVVNTNIGSGGLTFQSISANGAANGIVLNNTGTSGGLTVTGNGVNGESTTGGLITNTSGVGVSLTNTRDVSLTNLGISNTGSFGININSVTNFTYQDAAIINAGNENEENTIQILNLHGTSLIEDVRLDDIQEDGIQIRQDVDTDSNLSTFDTLTIRRLDLEDHQAGFGEAGIEIQTNLASTLAVVIDDSDFAINANATMGVATSTAVGFTGHQKMTIQNSTFDASAAFGSGAIQALGGGNGTATYLIAGNTITNTQFDGIRVNNDGGHTNVTITNNDIDGSAVNNGEGITLRQDGNGSMTVLISGNDMTEITSNQIHIQASDATIDDSTVNVEATITNNTGTAASFGAGLLVDVGDGSGIAKNDVRINVTGNDLNGTNFVEFFDFDITLNLNETSGASLQVTQASDAALEAANGGSTVSSFANPPNTITYNAGTPPLPPLPLLAAEGGVASASGTPGDHDLTSPELSAIVQAAVSRWADAGLTAAQLSALDGVQFEIADLGGSYLGVSAPGLIVIDNDAGGHGWFIDSTPFDDGEFGHALSATQLQTDPYGAPAGQMDLLSAVMHEIGHALGLDHAHDGSGGDLMSDALVTGERRLPADFADGLWR